MTFEDYQKIYFNPEIVKRKTWPKCSSNDILFIAYGLVDPDDYQQEVILGGCGWNNYSLNVVCRTDL